MRQQLLASFKQHRQLLPLLLLSIYCIDAIITAISGTVVEAGVTYHYLLNIKHYIAFGAIGLNILTYFFSRRFYKYTLALTIALGLINLITFTAIETRQSFGFNSLSISFQPSAFLAGLLAYILNFKKLNKFIFGSLVSRQTVEELEQSNHTKFTEAVEKFKEKYAAYSTDTLTKIISANKYVPEALEAAQQLLGERQQHAALQETALEMSID